MFWHKGFCKKLKKISGQFFVCRQRNLFRWVQELCGPDSVQSYGHGQKKKKSVKRKKIWDIRTVVRIPYKCTDRDKNKKQKNCVFFLGEEKKI